MSDLRDAESEQIRKLLTSIPNDEKLETMQRNSLDCNSAATRDSTNNSSAKKQRGRRSARKSH